jgi:hypothetical protein
LILQTAGIAIHSGIDCITAHTHKGIDRRSITTYTTTNLTSIAFIIYVIIIQSSTSALQFHPILPLGRVGRVFLKGHY